MNVNPVCQQPLVENTKFPSVAKVAAIHAEQQLAPESDTVALSQKAKDLAAQQAAKAVSEEANDSISPTQQETLRQFEGIPLA